ncbi:MAG TPA: acyl-CoA dehydratase activase [Termitinemataceae bacterium]|mgnify:CR=1 FL=1|nr:acyl-CoA dehydratase activase [Termitinemataceae bacterium]HOM23250.1 acyl-CoA dehydratase activase [Termitinemataceae bacterium]HPQ00202.1 acyl-CoA dehydratase activase [Termitinemataceae bacterium]
MRSLGINIGSTSLKMVLSEHQQVLWQESIPHEGDFYAVVRRLCADGHIEPGTPALVTGNEGRFMFNVAGTLEPLCVEAALKALNLKPRAVVSMGGEDLVVYSLDENGKIINNFSGSKCASGTGEFLKQQLARMNMTLQDVNAVPDTAQVLTLSSRCSVFMKSDCTHRLNKREATKEDIVLSLSNVMAMKVLDFLKRAKLSSGQVVLTGGVTLNRHIIRFLKEGAPTIEFIIPDIAPVFEAFGASILAPEMGSPLPSVEKLLKPNTVRFGTLGNLNHWRNKVRFFEKSQGKVQKGRSYILGVDGGSTTTKACLVDMETDEIVASHYGRTHGDPVRAVKECLKVIQDKVVADTGSKEVDIRLVATTGSSREILGVFLETPGVYNEIIAHSVGTTYFDKEVETIFEIGGQDAKYVLLKNGVPIDYAMNEACSAGTGSFLEESAAGDLSIHRAEDIAPIALKADAPLKFGEHCSAFINSDIRKAVQQGASRENITAGIVCSIVANYLNRVVGNRTIGGKIFLQGGVAKNEAVPLAFAMLLDKEILVPPSPELMGCFGVALLAKRKQAEGLLGEVRIDIDEVLQREIGYERVFKCQSCDNYCPIQVLKVNGHTYMFGGRCNKYTNMRKAVKDVPVLDYVSRRNKLLFEEFVPSKESFVAKRNYTVGIPRAFSVHTLYPLYTWFFHELGIRTILSDTVDHEGVARAESAYCFPAEIAHGAVADCLKKGADYVLLPHFRDMPSYETSVHANFCPITQSFPYYITKAFSDVDPQRFLPLVVSFKFGEKKALELFTVMTSRLGISEDETRRAFEKALAKQKEYFEAARKLGLEALEEARRSNRPVIAILGRPYNAFTAEANMGIPRKFTTRGYSVIPFDILPIEEQPNQFPNMYWYYGQQDMRAAQLLKNEENVYVTWITNFSCAPDSFMLHYLKWIMGQKPFLVLELDSHSADAGIDTRVEAFLDIIDGYRSKKLQVEQERYDNGWKFEYGGGEDLRVVNHKTGQKVPVRNNPKVKILLSNMGNVSTEFMAAMLRGVGLNAEALPVADFKTIQIARAHASGKECVPSHLVLGSALKYFASDKYRKDELYLLFVPITTGPCRTGQYFVYYENLFRDLRLENVVVFTLSADNSYTELGPDFAKDMWKGLVVTDYLKDIQTALKATARDPERAVADFEASWKKMMGVIEKDPRLLWKELRRIAEDVKRIPLKRALAECPRVLIVGEIYVRRDDFAVGELIDLMSERGIVVKVSGIAEWIHYLDFVREYALKKLIRLQAPWKRPFCKPQRDLIKLYVEEWWKHHIEKKVLSILEPTGLIPETPHDMHLIMKNTQEHFVNLELNSEIAVSSGVAATAMEHGYSGVVNISPFACLIGRVIEGLFTPWARERNYPTISVEVDGNLLPPSIINKLNIFMVNVLRFKGNDDVSSLVDRAGATGVAVTGHLAGTSTEMSGTANPHGGGTEENRRVITAVPLTNPSPNPEDVAGGMLREEGLAPLGSPRANQSRGGRGTEEADTNREDPCTGCGGCSK